MRDGSGRPDEVGTGWLIWAVAVVPVMFILPFYVFPLYVGRHIHSYDGRRLLEILWAAGLLLALLRPSIRAGSMSIWSRLSLPTRVAATLFVAGALASAIASSAPAYALREWSLITLLVVVTLPLGAMLAARRMRVLEAVALTLVLYAILVVASPLDHGFTHPRFLGQTMAVLAPALLFSGHRTLALLAAPALAIGVLNGSRALWLTLVVVTVAALVLWPDRRQRMLPGLAGLAVAGLLVAVLAAVGHEGPLQEAVERGVSSTGRDRLWRDAFEHFIGAPLLGVGPGLLARAPGLAGWGGHPHNSVLLFAAELGLVGLGALAVLVVQGLRRLPRLAMDRRPWALALLGGGVHSLFSGTNIMPASQAMLVLALALVLPATGRPGSEGPAGGRTGWMLFLLGAVALAILLATLFLPPVPYEGQLQGPRFFTPGIIP